MMHRLLLAVFLVAAFAVAGAAEEKTEIDNEWVRVLRVKQGPHEKSQLHEHPMSVVVYLTDLRQKITLGNGKTSTLSKKAGDVAYFEATRQSEENLSDKPLEAVVVELKKSAPRSIGWPVTLDPVKLDPKHHPVALENNNVRALRTILEPHLKGPEHQHPAYVVVYLTELHTTQTLGDGRVVDNVRRPGDVAWRDALKHVTENVGEKRAEEIQIEMK